MLRFILRRLLQAIPIVLATTFLAYGIIRAAPGDPVQMLVGDPKKIPASVIENLKRQLGLDKPWYVSYVYWLRNLVYNPAPPPIIDVVLDKETMTALRRSSLNLRIDRDSLILVNGQSVGQREAASAVFEKQEKQSGSMKRTLKVPKTSGVLREAFDKDRQADWHAIFIWTKEPMVIGIFDEASANDNEVSNMNPRQRVEVLEINNGRGEVRVKMLEEDGQPEKTLLFDNVSLQLRQSQKRVRASGLPLNKELLLVTRDRETSKLFALADQQSADQLGDLSRFTWRGEPLAVGEAGLYAQPVKLRAVVAQPAKTFDLGQSFTERRPVTELYLEALNNTFFLVLMVLVLEFIIAIPIGIVVALKKNSVLDYVLTFLTFVGISLPNFWLALIMLMIFSYNLGWFPSGGMQTSGTTFSWSDWSSVVDRLRHMAMPLTVMTLGALAGTMRYTRAAVLDVIHQDYVRTAKAKGLPYNTVIMRHVLKNAMIPIITLLGLTLPFLIGGSFIVETIFSWPGMGKLGLSAVFQRDYPMIMAGILFGSMMIILGQLLADVLYAWANPRIRKSFES
ncbi:MAG: hypothetical protein GEEBNDBF_02113 [bacterium]|nr:hypothetical protein [bacterium]